MPIPDVDPDEKPKILEQYMPRLEEFIFVEERIITRKILSHLLFVKIHISNFLIKEFHKKHKDELYTFYEVDGKTHDNIFIMQTCGQDKVEEGKKKIIGTVYMAIYSIQKLGTDTSKEARLTAEMEFLASNIELLPMAFPDIKKRPPVQASPVVPDLPKPPKVEKNDNSTEKKEPEKKNGDVEKSSGQSKLSSSSSSKPLKKQSNAKGNKAGGIGQFFGKQSTLAAKKPQEPKEPTVKEEPVESDNKETEEKLDISEDEAMEVDEKPSPKVSTKKKPSKSKSKKLPTSSSKSKKRKRIVAASDSESNEEEDDIVEEELPEEPPAQPVLVESDEDEVIPPTPNTTKGKRRVRKLVDKNYEDADGFIITKKEYIYESCSDSNEGSPSKVAKKNGSAEKESPDKKEDKGTEETSNNKETGDTKQTKSGSKSNMIFADVKPKGKTKKEASPQKGKQTSLMNFFKKK